MQQLRTLEHKHTHTLVKGRAIMGGGEDPRVPFNDRERTNDIDQCHLAMCRSIVQNRSATEDEECRMEQWPALGPDPHLSMPSASETSGREDKRSWELESETSEYTSCCGHRRPGRGASRLADQMGVRHATPWRRFCGMLQDISGQRGWRSRAVAGLAIACYSFVVKTNKPMSPTSMYLTIG